MQRLGPLGRGLVRWVDGVCRGALWVVLGACAVTAVLAYFTVTRLGIDMETAGMLSPELEWRQDYQQYKEEFPQFVDTVVVVLDGDTPELARRAQERLAERLAAEPDLYQYVYQPQGSELFERNGFLYLDRQELEQRIDNLVQVQPFLGRLVQDPTPAGLFEMLGEAIADEQDRFDLTPALQRVRAAIDAVLAGEFHRMSWQELMEGGDATVEERRRLVIAQPKIDYSQVLPGRQTIKHIRRTARELNLDPAHGVRVRLTGSVPLAYDEIASVSRGAGVAALLALAAVAVILYLGLRSLRLLVASVITLLIGLVATAAFAAATVGDLNLISVAFAVLYIGLGVAFSVHLGLRYRELRELGEPHTGAIRHAASDVGAALTLCAVTTAVGFYSFLPTAFQGVAELGLISGTGMFISLVVTLTVLPALLTLFPVRVTGKLSGFAARGPISALLDAPRRYWGRILVVSAIAGVAAAATLPWVSFNPDPMSLKDPRAESVSTFQELLRDSETPPWSISVLRSDVADAQKLAGSLAELDTVDKALTLQSFIPKNQDDKLALIDDLRLMLGTQLELMNPDPELDVARQRRSLAELQTELNAYQGPGGAELQQSVERLQRALSQRDDEAQGALLGTLQDSLMGSFAFQMQSLERLLQAEAITRDTLPDKLVRQWVSDNGRHRVEVFPEGNAADNHAMHAFVKDVREVAPDATGAPVVNLMAGETVVQALREAFVLAVVAIAVLLVVLLRSVIASLEVMIPLLLAGVLTAAASVLFGISFNFANVIALPLILGVGVDNGIHMVHRNRFAPPSSGNLLITSTGRAVLVAALTTIASFGSLAFSEHAGTASMGRILAIGIGLTLLCTFVVLPALVRVHLHIKARRESAQSAQA